MHSILVTFGKTDGSARTRTSRSRSAHARCPINDRRGLVDECLHVTLTPPTAVYGSVVLTPLDVTVRGCDFPVFDWPTGLRISLSDCVTADITPRRVVHSGKTETDFTVSTREPSTRINFDGFVGGTTIPTVGCHEVPSIVVPAFEFHS
jgi:hypothetical protein